MKTLLRFSIVPAILVGVAFFLHAQETGPSTKTGTVLSSRTATSWRGTSRGSARPVVRAARHRRSLARADKAARLCADWDEAVAYAQTLIRPTTPANVRLARTGAICTA